MADDALNRTEQIALKEYEFADKLRENYFTSSWVATSIILPISFGLIGVSYVDKLLTLNGYQLIPLALASTFLYLFWLGYVIRYAGYMKAIYVRSKWLEKTLGMHLHRQIEYDDNGFDQKLEEDSSQKNDTFKINSLRNLNVTMFFLLLLAWIFRLLLPPLSV